MSPVYQNNLEKKKTNRVVFIALTLFSLISSLIYVHLKLNKRTNNKNEFVIVATTGMIADAIKNITKDTAKVLTLLGPGVDPHSYKATPGDLRKINQAHIIYYNGLHLEGKMESIFKKLSKKKKVFAVTHALAQNQLIRDPNFPESANPHFWFDTSLFQQAVKYMSKTLKEANPEHADAYEQNTLDYLERLEKLKENVYESINKIPTTQRLLVTAHDAFAYFGKAYGIEVNSLQGTSTMAEYGIKDMTHLIEIITKRNIKAIFVETSVPTKPIEAVVAGCRQKGHVVKIGGFLYSDAMGESGTPEGTYEGMLLSNTKTIVNALQ